MAVEYLTSTLFKHGNCKKIPSGNKKSFNILKCELLANAYQTKLASLYNKMNFPNRGPAKRLY